MNLFTLLESYDDPNPITQSSANARIFRFSWSMHLIPIIFSLIFLIKGSMEKLYSIGDKGSPCFSPLLTLTSSVVKLVPITLKVALF